MLAGVGQRALDEVVLRVERVEFFLDALQTGAHALVIRRFVYVARFVVAP